MSGPAEHLPVAVSPLLLQLAQVVLLLHRLPDDHLLVQGLWQVSLWEGRGVSGRAQGSEAGVRLPGGPSAAPDPRATAVAWPLGHEMQEQRRPMAGTADSALPAALGLDRARPPRQPLHRLGPGLRGLTQARPLLPRLLLEDPPEQQA